MAVVPVLVGTHHYEWAIKIFAYLFSRYWGNEKVIYFGDRIESDLPENLEFRQVPIYSQGEWPWEFWFGNGLMSICDAMAGDVVALFLPDHWLNRPVDLEIVKSLEEYMRFRPNLLRANLTEDESWENAELVRNWQELKILEVKPWDIHTGLNGGVTFCPSLWRMEKLKRMIEPHWTLWACETLGTERVKLHYPKVRVIGSNPAALSRVHGLVHGKPKLVNLTGLNDEDKGVALSYLPEGWRIC